MKITQNTISRDWTIVVNGKTYYVNYTNSDGQTLALCNRDYWEVYDKDGEELRIYIFKDTTEEQKKEIQKNIELMNKLIEFCIKNWDIPENLKPK
ncbi:MAG: hypothetical protein ACE5KE_00535 [Methanosarcinales archaeon]